MSAIDLDAYTATLGVALMRAHSGGRASVREVQAIIRESLQAVALEAGGACVAAENSRCLRVASDVAQREKTAAECAWMEDRDAQALQHEGGDQVACEIEDVIAMGAGDAAAILGIARPT